MNLVHKELVVVLVTKVLQGMQASRVREVYKDLKVLKESVAYKDIQEVLALKVLRACLVKMESVELQESLETLVLQALLVSQE